MTDRTPTETLTIQVTHEIDFDALQNAVIYAIDSQFERYSDLEEIPDRIEKLSRKKVLRMAREELRVHGLNISYISAGSDWEIDEIDAVGDRIRELFPELIAD